MLEMTHPSFNKKTKIFLGEGKKKNDVKFTGWPFFNISIPVVINSVFV